MATNPTDYIAGLGGIGALPNPVRDFNAGAASTQALRTTELQQQAASLQLQQAQAKQQRQDQFQNDILTLGTDPTPGGIASMIRKYPEFAEQLKAAHDVQDEAKKASDFRTQSQVWAAARNGRPDLAAQLLQAHEDASIAAGEAPDPTDAAIIAALKSDDPAEQKLAMSMIGMAVAAINPKKFDETYNALNKGQEGFTLNPGDVRFDADGKEIASVAAKPEYRNVGAGETIVEIGGSGGGIAPTGAAIESAVLAAVPGATVTSGARTPEKNAEVGGVPNSYHLTDQARDVVPPAGMSMAAFEQTVRATLPGGFRVLNEGDHLHIQPAARGAGAGGARVVAQGAPKPGYRFLTGQEKAAQGLPANVAFQISPEGQVTAPSGQDTKTQQARAVPVSAQKSILENHSTIREIKRAIDLVKARPQSFGYGNKLTPDFILQRSDKEGNAARAAVGKIGGKIIHDVSGAAVTLSEAPRFQPYVPAPDGSDASDTVLTKLQQMLSLAEGEQGDLVQAYGPENGYRGVRLPGQPAPPVRVNTPAEASKLKSGTFYTTPDGRLFRR